MSPALVEAVGLMAGAMTTISFVPQVLRAWRTGSVRDLSSWMLAIFTTGVVLWFAYGILLGKPSLIIANVLTFGLASILIGYKVRDAWRRPEE